MSTIKSYVQLNSEPTRNNQHAMSKLLDEVKSIQQHIQNHTSEQTKLRYQSEGKLLPRQRLDILLDAGSPFLEIDCLPPMRYMKIKFLLQE